MMGINNVPNVYLCWDSNEFIGNSGIKKIFTTSQYLKLVEYLKKF